MTPAFWKFPNPLLNGLQLRYHVFSASLFGRLELLRTISYSLISTHTKIRTEPNLILNSLPHGTSNQKALELAHLSQIDITLLELNSLLNDRDAKKRTEPNPRLVAHGAKSVWLNSSSHTSLFFCRRFFVELTYAPPKYIFRK